MNAGVTGKPGVQSSFSATPFNIFYDSKDNAKYIPGPVTIDGTLSADATNTPYTWLLRAGMLVGKVSASGKFATSILGITTGAYTSGGTTLAVSVATAVELARRIGVSGTGTFNVVGPPTAAGTVAKTPVTYSAVDQTTGNITVTSLGVNKVAGSLIVPADGSETVVTVLTSQWGVKVIDSLNTTRVDVYDGELWAGGGILEPSKLLNWPTDTSLIAYLKAQMRLSIPDAKFRDDLANT